MDVTGPALTPQRRGHGAAGASGSTPPAKRPASRPEMTDPAMADMSLQDLTAAFLRLQHRYELDVHWHGQHHEVLISHAEALDQHKEFFKTTGFGIQAALKDFTEIKDVVNRNDEHLKEQLKANDQYLKEQLKANDLALKSSMDIMAAKLDATIKGVEDVHQNSLKEVNRLRDELDAAGVAAGAPSAVANQIKEVADKAEATAVQMEIIRQNTEVGFEKVLASAREMVQEAMRNIAHATTDPWQPAADARHSTRVSAQRNNIGTPEKLAAEPTVQKDFASYKVKDIYEEKYASNPLHMYDPKSPDDWFTTTRDYLVGRNPVMDTLLKWAEAKGDEEIEPSEVASLREPLG